MLQFEAADLTQGQQAVLGQAIRLRIVGKGWGMIHGAMYLKRYSRDHSLRKGSAHRKNPVSTRRPFLKAVSRVPRFVRAGDVVTVILNEPSIRIALHSLPFFQKFEITVNPKGVLAQTPSIRSNAGTWHSGLHVAACVKGPGPSTWQSPAPMGQPYSSPSLQMPVINNGSVDPFLMKTTDLQDFRQKQKNQ